MARRRGHARRQSIRFANQSQSKNHRSSRNIPIDGLSLSFSDSLSLSQSISFCGCWCGARRFLAELRLGGSCAPRPTPPRGVPPRPPPPGDEAGVSDSLGGSDSLGVSSFASTSIDATSAAADAEAGTGAGAGTTAAAAVGFGTAAGAVAGAVAGVGAAAASKGWSVKPPFAAGTSLRRACPVWRTSWLFCRLSTRLDMTFWNSSCA